MADARVLHRCHEILFGKSFLQEMQFHPDSEQRCRLYKKREMFHVLAKRFTKYNISPSQLTANPKSIYFIFRDLRNQLLSQI